MRKRSMTLASVLMALVGLAGCSDVAGPTATGSTAEASSTLSANAIAGMETFFLFGHNNARSFIEAIDRTDGSRTDIGATGFSSGASGMATARGEVPGPDGVVYPAGTHFGLLEDVTDGTDWVAAVDTETGEATKVVRADRNIVGRGAAFGPDGVTLYVIEDVGRLRTVSTVDGSVTEIGATVASAALEWDPASEKFLAIANSRLYELDPATGAFTERGFIGINSITLARSPGGDWFAPSTSTSQLYAIDVTAPSATVLGGTGLASFGGTAFAPKRTVNEPPENVSSGGPYSGDEGSDITFEAEGTDPEGTTVTFTWEFGDGSAGTGAAVTHAYGDDGSYDVTLTATDADGISRQVATTATVANVAPEIVSVTGPVDPQPVGTGIVVETTFDDPGSADTHAASVDWGDGSSSSIPTVASSFQAAHTYTETGVYTVTVTVTDDDGGSDTGLFEFVVIFDPEAGFVTGSGQIDSPPGAYVRDPTVSGSARFGFSSRYRRGATTPDGRTRFQFRAADLRFVSDRYEWLVVSGARAQLKGTGSINRSGDFGFLLTAVDGDLSGGGGSDRFRIKIWDRVTDRVVYDNLLEADDDADPANLLRGKVTIHP